MSVWPQRLETNPQITQISQIPKRFYVSTVQNLWLSLFVLLCVVANRFWVLTTLGKHFFTFLRVASNIVRRTERLKD